MGSGPFPGSGNAGCRILCVLGHLGPDQNKDNARLASIGLDALVKHSDRIEPVLAADLLTRLHERNLLALMPQSLLDSAGRSRLVSEVKGTRPDLVPRLRAMFEVLSPDR